MKTLRLIPRTKILLIIDVSDCIVMVHHSALELQ